MVYGLCMCNARVVLRLPPKNVEEWVWWVFLDLLNRASSSPPGWFDALLSDTTDTRFHQGMSDSPLSVPVPSSPTPSLHSRSTHYISFCVVGWALRLPFSSAFSFAACTH
eukprot:RCo019385